MEEFWAAEPGNKDLETVGDVLGEYFGMISRCVESTTGLLIFVASGLGQRLHARTELQINLPVGPYGDARNFCRLTLFDKAKDFISDIVACMAVPKRGALGHSRYRFIGSALQRTY
jgi:hypothetical protein